MTLHRKNVFLGIVVSIMTGLTSIGCGNNFNYPVDEKKGASMRVTSNGQNWAIQLSGPDGLVQLNVATLKGVNRPMSVQIVNGIGQITLSLNSLGLDPLDQILSVSWENVQTIFLADLVKMTVGNDCGRAHDPEVCFVNPVFTMRRAAGGGNANSVLLYFDGFKSQLGSDKPIDSLGSTDLEIWRDNADQFGKLLAFSHGVGISYLTRGPLIAEAILAMEPDVNTTFACFYVSGGGRDFGPVVDHLRKKGRKVGKCLAGAADHYGTIHNFDWSKLGLLSNLADMTLPDVVELTGTAPNAPIFKDLVDKNVGPDNFAVVMSWHGFDHDLVIPTDSQKGPIADGNCILLSGDHSSMREGDTALALRKIARSVFKDGKIPATPAGSLACSIPHIYDPVSDKFILSSVTPFSGKDFSMSFQVVDGVPTLAISVSNLSDKFTKIQAMLQLASIDLLSGTLDFVGSLKAKNSDGGDYFNRSVSGYLVMNRTKFEASQKAQNVSAEMRRQALYLTATRQDGEPAFSSYSLLDVGSSIYLPRIEIAYTDDRNHSVRVFVNSHWEKHDCWGWPICVGIDRYLDLGGSILWDRKDGRMTMGDRIGLNAWGLGIDDLDNQFVPALAGETESEVIWSYPQRSCSTLLWGAWQLSCFDGNTIFGGPFTFKNN